jgi:hypothetical protein
MAAMKATIENEPDCYPILMLHWPENVARNVQMVVPGEWSRMPGGETLGRIMGIGSMKTALFDGLREIVRVTGADGSILGSVMWRARITDEGRMRAREICANVDSRFDQLVKLGWMAREESVQVVGQTAVDVVLMSDAYRRRTYGIEWIGELRIKVVPQDGFTGPMKMFGNFTDETLGKPPKGSYADRHNRERSGRNN